MVYDRPPRRKRVCEEIAGPREVSRTSVMASRMTGAARINSTSAAAKSKTSRQGGYQRRRGPDFRRETFNETVYDKPETQARGDGSFACPSGLSE